MGGTNNDVYLIVLLVIWAIATLYAYIFDMDKKSIGPYQRLQRTENNLDPEVQTGNSYADAKRTESM